MSDAGSDPDRLGAAAASTWRVWRAAREQYAPSITGYQAALRAAALLDRARRALDRARVAADAAPGSGAEDDIAVLVVVDDLATAHDACTAAIANIRRVGRVNPDRRFPLAHRPALADLRWRSQLDGLVRRLAETDPLVVLDPAPRGTPERALEETRQRWRDWDATGGTATLAAVVDDLDALLARRWQTTSGPPVTEDVVWWRERIRNARDRRRPVPEDEDLTP